MLSELVLARKSIFVSGCHVRTTNEVMQDPYTPLPKELKGTVRHVDDMGTVHIMWENGSNDY